VPGWTLTAAPRISLERWPTSTTRPRGNSTGVNLDPAYESWSASAPRSSTAAPTASTCTNDARANGETEQRLYALNACRETPDFTERRAIPAKPARRRPRWRCAPAASIIPGPELSIEARGRGSGGGRRVLDAAGRDQELGLEDVGVQGLGEQEALGFVDVFTAEVVHLSGGLKSFGEGGQPKVFAELDEVPIRALDSGEVLIASVKLRSIFRQSTGSRWR
jgi:hypothetical protein